MTSLCRDIRSHSCVAMALFTPNSACSHCKNWVPSTRNPLAAVQPRNEAIRRPIPSRDPVPSRKVASWSFLNRSLRTAWPCAPGYSMLAQASTHCLAVLSRVERYGTVARGSRYGSCLDADLRWAFNLGCNTRFSSQKPRFQNLQGFGMSKENNDTMKADLTLFLK